MAVALGFLVVDSKIGGSTSARRSILFRMAFIAFGIGLMTVSWTD